MKSEEKCGSEREGAPALGGLFIFVWNQNPTNPWALLMASPLHWTSSLYIHPLHKTKNWKKTRGESNVVQWHLKNAYTKSEDEQYLYSGDDVAQEQTLQGPNINK